MPEATQPRRSSLTTGRQPRKACEAFLEDEKTRCTALSRVETRFCPTHGKEYGESTRRYKEASELADALRPQAITNWTQFHALRGDEAVSAIIHRTQMYSDAVQKERNGRVKHAARFFANEGQLADIGHQKRIQKLQDEMRQVKQMLSELVHRRDAASRAVQERMRESERRIAAARRIAEARRVAEARRIAEARRPAPDYYYGSYRPIHAPTGLGQGDGGDGPGGALATSLLIVALLGYGAYKLLSFRVESQWSPPQLSWGDVGEWMKARLSTVQDCVSQVASEALPLLEAHRPEEAKLEAARDQISSGFNIAWNSLSRLAAQVGEAAAAAAATAAAEAQAPTGEGNALDSARKWLSSLGGR